MRTECEKSLKKALGKRGRRYLRESSTSRRRLEVITKSSGKGFCNGKKAGDTGRGGEGEPTSILQAVRRKKAGKGRGKATAWDDPDRTNIELHRLLERGQDDGRGKTEMVPAARKRPAIQSEKLGGGTLSGGERRKINR